MTLYRLTLAPAYDPENPDSSSPVISLQCPCVGVTLPASQGTIEAFDNRALSDPIRLQKFRFVMLAGKGLTFTPEANDLLQMADGLVRVLGSTPLNPDSNVEAILFNVGTTRDVNFTLP
jgi:hypothetical protein